MNCISYFGAKNANKMVLIPSLGHDGLDQVNAWWCAAEVVAVVAAVITGMLIPPPRAMSENLVKTGRRCDRSFCLLNGTPIKQKYPLDCEAAALSMALDIQGAKVDEDTLLNDMGADTRPAVMNPDGTVKQWGNPYKTFVGNVHAPSEESGRGYGVYYPPIARMAEKHGHLAVSGEGVDPQVLYRELVSGNPSVVWIPFGLNPKPLLHWTSWDGQSIPYNFSEHAVTLVGIDTSTDQVALLDPYYGNESWYRRAQFEAAFRSFGRMAVTVL